MEVMVFVVGGREVRVMVEVMEVVARAPMTLGGSQ